MVAGKTLQQLADANQREAEARQDFVRIERELAMARHEVKEASRRSEQEQELRRKVEQERTELRKRLEDETNRRTKEQNNSHHVAEKISSLEKERNQVSCLCPLSQMLPCLLITCIITLSDENCPQK
jgi:chromosome segregation ATPase